MDEFIRRQITWHLGEAARRSIYKNHTKVIVIYGWDWVEGLREGMYQLLRTRVNARRNYDWIRWDLGLPLFILGYPNNPDQSKLQLLVSTIRAILSITFKPQRYQNYLIVSLNAKQEQTLQYWLQLIKLSELVILPLKENQDQQIAFLKSKIASENLVDLRKFLTLNLKQEQTKNIETVMLSLLLETAKDLPVLKKWKFNNTEIHESIMKVDWQRFLWDRIKLNLRKNNET